MWNYSVQWSYDSNSPATEVTDVQYKPSTDSHFVEQVDLVNGQLNTFIFNNPLLRKYQYCVLTANSLVVEKKNLSYGPLDDADDGRVTWRIFVVPDIRSVYYTMEHQQEVIVI